MIIDVCINKVFISTYDRIYNFGCNGLFYDTTFKELNVSQRVSVFVGASHKKKNGIPTVGGLIFIIPTFITILIMYFTNKIEINSNLLIVLIRVCCICYFRFYR